MKDFPKSKKTSFCFNWIQYVTEVVTEENYLLTCETSWMSQYFLQEKYSSSQEFGYVLPSEPHTCNKLKVLEEDFFPIVLEEDCCLSWTPKKNQKCGDFCRFPIKCVGRIIFSQLLHVTLSHGNKPMKLLFEAFILWHLIPSSPTSCTGSPWQPSPHRSAQFGKPDFVPLPSYWDPASSDAAPDP